MHFSFFCFTMMSTHVVSPWGDPLHWLFAIAAASETIAAVNAIEIDVCKPCCKMHNKAQQLAKPLKTHHNLNQDDILSLKFGVR